MFSGSVWKTICIFFFCFPCTHGPRSFTKLYLTSNHLTKCLLERFSSEISYVFVTFSLIIFFFFMPFHFRFFYGQPLKYSIGPKCVFFSVHSVASNRFVYDAYYSVLTTQNLSPLNVNTTLFFENHSISVQTHREITPLKTRISFKFLVRIQTI